LEINKFDKEITGVVPVADVVEGRFGLMTSHTFDHNYGSQTDLPGWKVPATAEEAKRARYVITWAVDNREYPLFQPVPSYSYALRGGFDQSQSHPFTATFYLSHPEHKDGLTIPSGMSALAFGKGVYTIPSGGYIYSASLKTPGVPVIVANTNEDSSDAGKLKYQSTMDERVIGFVREFNTSNSALTVEID
jgi:hypothetical protein